MDKNKRKGPKQQGSQGASEILTHRCYLFVSPLLSQLNQVLDRRLVQTFFDLLLVILIHRHRNQGLLLSELGGHLLGADRAPAGTKRIANLIHSTRWQTKLIEDYLWEQAAQKVQDLMHPQEDTYVIWDESVIEKPESLKAERLCAVRSSKARRLKRIKPGYFNPPGGRPIFVPGINWLQVVVAGLTGAPVLAHMRWWTTRGEAASQKRDEELAVLKRLAGKWSRQVIHIWDRGFAGAPWLTWALFYNVRFIVRWKKGNKLISPKGELKKAWEISRGKRSLDHRMIYDCKRRCMRKTGIVFLPVKLPDHPRQLWMVVSRPGKGRQPWYLLTSDPITTIEDAWRVVLAYNRRWQIEMSIRFDKSELAFESPRLSTWNSRHKLMLIAVLAHAFLLSLLSPICTSLCQWLLFAWCHRTGKRSRTASTPLYRLRLALSCLWLAFRPHSLPRLNPG
jgi:hypothetical protein